MTNLTLKSEFYANGKVRIDKMKATIEGQSIKLTIDNGKHLNGKPRGGKIHLSSEQAEALAEWIKNSSDW